MTLFYTSSIFCTRLEKIVIRSKSESQCRQRLKEYEELSDSQAYYSALFYLGEIYELSETLPEPEKNMWREIIGRRKPPDEVIALVHDKALSDTRQLNQTLAVGY